MTALFDAATIDDRVAAGAEWLDANRPGWVDRIDLDILDLGEPCHCILGQEWGDFYLAPSEARGFYGEVATMLGFDRGANVFYDGDGEGDEEYAALTEAWRRLIRARREGGAA